MDHQTTTNSSGTSTLLYILIGLFSAVICISLCGIVTIFIFGLGLGNHKALPNPTHLPVGDPNDLTVQAMDLMNEGKYEEALPLWTAIIVQAPHRGMPYYQRALCYYNLVSQQSDKQAYKIYADNALTDINRAIAIQPDLGDYYALRHDLQLLFAALEDYRVDQHALVRIAHENAGAAITLGYSDNYRFTKRFYVEDLTRLEQCDQSLLEIEQLLKEIAPGDSSITEIYRMKGGANACLGNYEEAVQALDASLQNPTSAALKTYFKASYLYQSGKLEEALAILNANLSSEPYYSGERYYLRALIYYDLGEKDKAQADLETGSLNTWSRARLYAYVSGKLALEAGQKEQAINLLQQAEATLDENHMLIRLRIIKELAALGAEPLTFTPSLKIDSTAIPIHQP